MKTIDFGAFITLADTLKWSGWEIVKFKNLGEGVKLTIVPAKDEKPETGEAG
jgi:hypothetical protein